MTQQHWCLLTTTIAHAMHTHQHKKKIEVWNYTEHEPVPPPWMKMTISLNTRKLKMKIKSNQTNRILCWIMFGTIFVARAYYLYCICIFRILFKNLSLFISTRTFNTSNHSNKYCKLNLLIYMYTLFKNSQTHTICFVFYFVGGPIPC